MHILLAVSRTVTVPYAPLRLRSDLFQSTPARYRTGKLIEEPLSLAVDRVLVSMLDQEPFFFVFMTSPRLHPHQHPASLKLLPMQRELEISLFEPFMRVDLGLPGAPVPEFDRAGPVFSLGDRAFEFSIFKGMVLHPGGQTAVTRVQRRPFGHRPGEEYAV
jgi:hypothetical protein